MHFFRYGLVIKRWSGYKLFLSLHHDSKHFFKILDLIHLLVVLFFHHLQVQRLSIRTIFSTIQIRKVYILLINLISKIICWRDLANVWLDVCNWRYRCSSWVSSAYSLFIVCKLDHLEIDWFVFCFFCLFSFFLFFFIFLFNLYGRYDSLLVNICQIRLCILIFIGNIRMLWCGLICILYIRFILFSLSRSNLLDYWGLCCGISISVLWCSMRRRFLTSDREVSCLSRYWIWHTT